MTPLTFSVFPTFAIQLNFFVPFHTGIHDLLSDSLSCAHGKFFFLLREAQ